MKDNKGLNESDLAENELEDLDWLYITKSTKNKKNKKLKIKFIRLKKID